MWMDMDDIDTPHPHHIYFVICFIYSGFSAVGLGFRPTRRDTCCLNSINNLYSELEYYFISVRSDHTQVFKVFFKANMLTKCLWVSLLLYIAFSMGGYSFGI